MIESLAQDTPSKIVLLVLDGLGGIPSGNGKTELETANTPNLDALAKKSATGLTDPVSPGITPGSGPAHLALFGYDPVKHEIGRGVLEALGVGVNLTSRDVAARGNFATKDANGVITDRRAGRISTEENKRICTSLQREIKQIDGVEIFITSGKEHRFVLVLRGDNLSDQITETDPQKIGIKPITCEATKPEAKETARVVQKFIEKAEALLKPPANTVLLRGFAKHPRLPSMQERFKLKPCAIATYPMYKGLAKLVGMEVVDTGATPADEVETLRKHWNDYNFFYIHIKRIDSMGEDGNFESKVSLIEEADKIIPNILKLNPDVFVVTADHSTPSVLKSHSWHPNPFLLFSKYVIPDDVAKFTERTCMKGGLGRLRAVHAIPLMLANALKLKKFGA
jgi:2,3-bisphosphoglycerate-independent phosphoglycerate mutase